MRVFDFDNTIYDGESLVDFFLFLVGKNRSLLVFCPVVMYVFLLYKMGRLSSDMLYNLANRYSYLVVKYQSEISSLVSEFWDRNSCKLKRDLLQLIGDDDVIVTASPNILIDGIRDKLPTNNIICSTINYFNGNLELACLGEEKVIAFKDKYPNENRFDFYTDSFSDMPFIFISENAYLVKKNNICMIKKNGEFISRYQRLNSKQLSKKRTT